jgi:branched-chain amino acid transport system permease protein
MIKKYGTQLFLLAAIVVSLVISLFADQIDDFYLHIFLTAGINVILAVSLNLVNGHTGQFSLGHAAFMAVGAYGSSVLTLQFGSQLMGMLGGGSLAQGILFLGALLVGGICAAIMGWLVGVPSLRLRGDYLAIVTLGFNQIIVVALENTDPNGPLGGQIGLRGIENYTNFFWVFSLVAITIYVVGSMVNSTYGRGFLAVRDDEVASESMGINTVRYKVLAFTIGAFFAGIAGGLYAHLNNSISAGGFGFQLSVDVVVMVILGGMGSTLGVAVAAVLLTGLTVLLRDILGLTGYIQIITALLLIVMMIVRPQGLLPNVVLQRKKKTA